MFRRFLGECKNVIFLFCLFLKPLKIVNRWLIQTPQNVLCVWHYSVQGSTVKKRCSSLYRVCMCWFFFSCCVACGRTECLRPKNIQHGGVQRALALCSVGLWPQLIQSGFWFSLPLLPPSPSTSTVSIGNKSVVQVPPSSRMHVLFHSCWVAWYLRNEYLGFCLDNHMCVRLRQRLLRAPWTSWLQDWTSCHHNGTETGSSIRWRRGNCSGDVKALKHSSSERLHTCPTHQHTCGRAQSVAVVP